MDNQYTLEKISRLLEAGPAVIYTAKAYGDYGATFISGNIRKQLGYEPEDFINDPTFWISNIHPDDVDKVIAGLEDLFKHGHHIHEYRFRKINGTYVWMRDELSLHMDNNGEAEEIIGYWADITEQKKIDNIKDELISIVSHELRTPLTSIRGALGLMNSLDNSTSQTEKNLMEIALRNSERLGLLIDDLLDEEKLSTGNMRITYGKHDVISLIKRSLDDNQIIANNHNILLRIDEDSDDVCIRADKNRLIQVLNNLISNAIKFSKSDSTVTVSSALNEGVVRITVIDNGCGISKDFQPNVFKRFMRADTSNQRKTQGAGLGLSICKQLMEMMQGNIGFESKEGDGSIFYADIPEYTDSSNISAGQV